MSFPLYIESSAVLTWLLGEPGSAVIQLLLQQAPLLLTSELTMIECERALHRLKRGGNLTNMQSQQQRRHLGMAASRWKILAIDRTVVEGAKNTFPIEPVRALDALHLSTALTARSMVSSLAILSLDQRIRDNAPPLGFAILP